jgi:hypothetical protein
MTTATLPLVSDYQAVLQDIRETFTIILAHKEEEQLAKLPEAIRENLWQLLLKLLSVSFHKKKLNKSRKALAAMFAGRLGCINGLPTVMWAIWVLMTSSKQELEGLTQGKVKQVLWGLQRELF